MEVQLTSAVAPAALPTAARCANNLLGRYKQADSSVIRRLRGRRENCKGAAAGLAQLAAPDDRPALAKETETNIGDTFSILQRTP